MQLAVSRRHMARFEIESHHLGIIVLRLVDGFNETWQLRESESRIRIVINFNEKRFGIA